MHCYSTGQIDVMVLLLLRHAVRDIAVQINSPFELLEYDIAIALARHR